MRCRLDQTRIVRGAVLAVLLTVSGCEIFNALFGAEGLVCKNDEACPAGSLCIDGACLRGVLCEADSDCGSGQRCEVTRSVCVASALDAGATDTAPLRDAVLVDALNDSSPVDAPRDAGLGEAQRDAHLDTAAPDTAARDQMNGDATLPDGALPDGDGARDSALADAVAASCGNGALDIQYGEECDDNNGLDGDGCSSLCQFEPVGGHCSDGVEDITEKCDDHNLFNGDGCNPTCNLSTRLSTLQTGVDAIALAIDDRWIWLGDCAFSGNQCTVSRIDRRACVAGGSCALTVVAGGLCGIAQDGTGETAVFGCVGSLASDGATVWIGDTRTIRAFDVDTASVRTVAGDFTLCGTRDGVGSASLITNNRGMVYDSGYIYFLDDCDAVVRRFDPVTSNVVTLAGSPTNTHAPFTCPPSNCSAALAVDGHGAAARFVTPRYLASDHSGTLYIVDTNGTALRSYDIATGYVGTLVSGIGYQDGTGAAVRIERPRGIATDGTSLYWKEQTSYTVRQLELSSLTASTLVGVRGCAGSRDGTGGDGTQDWSQATGGGCNHSAVSSLPQIQTSISDIVFDFEHRSLLLTSAGRLLRVE